MLLVPARFLFRVTHPCHFREKMPTVNADRLLDLGPEYRIDNFAGMDGKTNFGEVALAWNDRGIGVQFEVRGKSLDLVGDLARPKSSDGLTLWIDTRDARTSHRASRNCHQFHFLATGGGEDHEEPAFAQTKIHRALEDSPLVSASDILLRRTFTPQSYIMEIFIMAAALHGYDPEQHPRLGFFYSLKDEEKGEQVLGVGPEFPFWEDPTLWSSLELVKK